MIDRTATSSLTRGVRRQPPRISVRLRLPDRRWPGCKSHLRLPIAPILGSPPRHLHSNCHRLTSKGGELPSGERLIVEPFLVLEDADGNFFTQKNRLLVIGPPMHTCVVAEHTDISGNFIGLPSNSELCSIVASV